MSKIGHLFVIAAPSGAGKTSLVRALVESEPDVCVSVSHTTRPPRPADVSGRDYHFVSTDEFSNMVEAGLFWEHATVFGHQYGTSQAWVKAQLQLGVDVILEIDWQGAQQIRQQFDRVISVFILPPSLSVLRERLEQRQQDAPEVIESRMEAARSEMLHYAEFNFLIVNDIFSDALEQLRAIVRSAQLKTSEQAMIQADLLAQLLKKQ